MKDYKAEIDEILLQIAGTRMTTIDDGKKIFALFREIAKEALGEQEHFQSIFDGTDGFIRRIRNEFREEILSNIEKVI